GLYGHGAVHLPRNAADEEQSDLYVLHRPVYEAQSVATRHRGLDRFSDGQKAGRAGRDGIAVSERRREWPRRIDSEKPRRASQTRRRSSPRPRVAQHWDRGSLQKRAEGMVWRRSGREGETRRGV